MKKIITMAVLIFSSMLTYACTGGTEQKQAETQKTAQDGSVIVMNKAMFIKDIFDYEKSKEWKYKGDKPAIIDLCRLVRTLPDDSAYYEGTGERICRENRNIQSQCG